jgi:hypothetical protein
MIAAMGWRIAGALVVAIAVGAAAVPIPSAWVEQYYARGWFPWAQRVLTGISNAAPFALLDVLIAATGAAGLFGIVSVLRAPRGRRMAMLARRAWHGAIVASLAYLAFLGTWGCNYRRDPITARLDFDEARVTTEAVLALNDAAIRELTRLRPVLPARLDAWPDRDALAARLHPALAESARLLGFSAPVTPGRPKWTLLDAYLTRAGVSGMTDPFFLETLLASNLLPFEVPAVVAHEWGHLAGLARESDASFFGILVCLRGGDDAQYSAWAEIFTRTLAARDREGRREAVGRLPDAVRADFRAAAERAARDQVRAVSLLAWRTYDTYLRSQRVESGVRNYGEVVRILAGTRFDAGWRPVLRSVP